MVPVKDKRKMVPPDGGWGWMVVFGTALANTFNQSLLSVFGLIFGDKLTDMGENTVGAAWVANIMLLVTNFSGIVAGPALKNYSARSVTIVGSILAGGGMIAASFSTSVWHLIITYSFFTGLGIGLIQPSTFVAVHSYFSARKGTAVGLSMAGTGVGQMLMPHFVRLLLDSFGFKGTSLILGALAFNGVVGAVLFQPVKWHLKPQNVKTNEKKKLLSTDEPSKEKANSMTFDNEATKTAPIPIMRSQSFYEDVSSSLPCSLDVLTKLEEKGRIKRAHSIHLSPYEKSKGTKGTQTVGENIEKPNNLFHKIRSIFDLDLLLNLTFLNVIFCGALGFTSNQNFNMLFPFFLQQQIGLDRRQTAMCMSAIAATDIVGRVTIPSFTDKFKISSRVTFLFGCLTLTFSRFILCLQNQYVALLITSGVCGFFRSPLVVNQNLIVSDCCKDEESKIPAALGLHMVMKGITVISLGQLLGWVRDYTGSYVKCIYAQNSLLIMVGVLWLPELIYKKVQKTKI